MTSKMLLGGDPTPLPACGPEEKMKRRCHQHLHVPLALKKLQPHTHTHTRPCLHACASTHTLAQASTYCQGVTQGCNHFNIPWPQSVHLRETEIGDGEDMTNSSNREDVSKSAQSSGCLGSCDWLLT